jgi:Ca2+:H+ antiporter
LRPWAAAGVLVVVTIAVAACAEYLVDSIDSLVETAHISKTFVGLVLLPIVGNAAEHATAVVVAVKDKMDLAIGVAAGSSMQIALFVTPFLVILGWVIDQPMTLHFETFETVIFFLSVLVVTYVIQDGKSNYLEGAMVSFLSFSFVSLSAYGLSLANDRARISYSVSTASSHLRSWCTLMMRLDLPYLVDLEARVSLSVQLKLKGEVGLIDIAKE